MDLSYGRRDAVVKALHARDPRQRDQWNIPPEFYHIVNDMPAQQCGTCRFWADTAGQVYSGDCRRHAPTERDGNKSWPRTSSNDWCGEYEKFDPVAVAASLPLPPNPESDASDVPA